MPRQSDDVFGDSEDTRAFFYGMSEDEHSDDPFELVAELEELLGGPLAFEN